jgi:hypothetical protein
MEETNKKSYAAPESEVIVLNMEHPILDGSDGMEEGGEI